MTELSRIADQPVYEHLVTDITRIESMADRDARQTFEQMDRDMVLWRRGVITLASALIITGLALYAWAVA